MPGICYWCESQGLMQCINCKRNFCKFCIKNGQVRDESKIICFICGCYELTEIISTGIACESKTSSLIDREMQDMLHRFEDLCNNEKLANSIQDLLINIDTINSENIPDLLESLKSTIFSMLHDIQKLEIMINHAKENDQKNDVENLLVPLLRVVIKHHIFKRFTKFEYNRNINSFCKIKENNEIVNGQSSEYIDLTDVDKMDMSQASENSDDNERMQRSPLRLAEEEKSTKKFNIEEIDEEVENRYVVKEVSYNTNIPSPYLSNVKASPKAHETVNSLSISPVKLVSENTPLRRRRTKQLSDIERRSIRLRSTNTLNISDPKDSSFDTLHFDLTEAETVFKPSSDNDIILSETNSQFRSDLQKSVKSSKSSNKSHDSSPDRTCKNEINFKTLVEMNQSSSSSECNWSGDLNKFSKVIQRNKNSHLVCPAPINYEKPFLLKEMSKSDVIDELKPASNKTWSWERQPSISKCLIPVKSKLMTNGDFPKILNKPIIIHKTASTLVLDHSVATPTRGRPRLSEIEPVQLKRPVSPLSREATSESEEPKKKRGRPRKYFENIAPKCETSHPDISLEELVQHNSSDFK